MSVKSSNTQLPITNHQTDLKSAYVLVTPVRNEENYIGRTIQSVVSQTNLPKEWIIVSDGSTDNTDTIIEAGIQANPWIRLIKLPQRENASWRAVVENTTLGIKKLKYKKYDFLGLLDSDLEFEKTYFEQLINKFENTPNLGLSGGNAIDIGRPKTYIPRNLQEVPGAVQFFKRECFESIGGIIALPEGGWDALTAAVARKNGYKTRLASDLVVDHLKPNNIRSGNIVRRKWQRGIRDYALGYHPLFELIKCIDLIRERPYLISAFLWFCGYVSCYLSGRKRILEKELITFIQMEQMARLSKIFRRT